MADSRRAKYGRARDYILKHPDESKEAQARGAMVSTALIGTVRSQLVQEGKLGPARNSPTARMPLPLLPPDPPPEGTPDELAPDPLPPMPRGKGPKDQVLDHLAMTTLANMVDEIAGLDDEEIYKRLQRQCLTFALNPSLHPDTRMSASQMWHKLKDMGRQRDLGPGTPVTFQDGVERLADLHRACGPEMTLAAVHLAFTVQEATDEGEVPAQQSETEHGAPGTPSAPGSDAPLHSDDSTAGSLGMA